jgi:predicted porin
MTRFFERPQSSTLPILLLAGLFLGSCSSGGDGGGGASSTPPPSTSTPPPPVTQLVQQSYIKASNTGADDQFGYLIAFSGDTLVVGAPLEDSNANGVNGNQTNDNSTDSGAVYVFTRNAGVWTQQAYLKASNTNSGDQFGVSVAIDGDTLAVGATSESSNATGVNGDQTNHLAPDSGAVYVFTRTSGVWSQQAYIKASNTDAGDQFGVSVALAGDTLAVGAHHEDSNATGVNGNQLNNTALDSGAVYVFTRNAGVWTQQAYLKASNAAGEFGGGVTLAGDTLAVGAPFEDSNATGVNGNQFDTTAADAGAVYVFTRTVGVWSQQAYIKASNTDAGDRFGHDIKINGETLAVGARFEASASSGVNANQTDNSAFNAGAAYVFTRTGGVWSQQAYIKASNAGANKNFSGSISIEGDTLAVGSRLEDSNATGIDGNQGNSNAPASGAVYLFKRNAGVWTQTHYLKASNANADDEFGDSVALSGGTLAVAAWFEASNAIGINGNQADNSASKSGAAYIFGEQ